MWDLIGRATSALEIANHLAVGMPALVDAPVVGVVVVNDAGVLSELVTNRRVADLSGDELLAAIVATRQPMHDLMLYGDDAWRTLPDVARFGRRGSLRHYGGSPVILDGRVKGIVACAREEGSAPLDAEVLLTTTTVAMHVQDRLARLAGHRPRELLQSLTQRQRQLCRQVALGKTNQEIASDLQVGIDAVKWHLKEIFKKLAIESRDDLIGNFLFWEDHVP
jgi:DNA-binding NarL/FixJ family response regulator